MGNFLQNIRDAIVWTIVLSKRMTEGMCWKIGCVTGLAIQWFDAGQFISLHPWAKCFISVNFLSPPRSWTGTCEVCLYSWASVGTCKVTCHWVWYVSATVRNVCRPVAWAKFLGGQSTHCLCRAPPSLSRWCMYDLEISGQLLPLLPLSPPPLPLAGYCPGMSLRQVQVNQWW